MAASGLIGIPGLRTLIVRDADIEPDQRGACLSEARHQGTMVPSQENS